MDLPSQCNNSHVRNLYHILITYIDILITWIRLLQEPSDPRHILSSQTIMIPNFFLYLRSMQFFITSGVCQPYLKAVELPRFACDKRGRAAETPTTLKALRKALSGIVKTLTASTALSRYYRSLLNQRYWQHLVM